MWLLVGAAISGLMHVLLPDGFIRRRFRGNTGVLKAVAFGVPLPLCSCGVVPTAIGLKKDGASDGASVAFLISTPQTGVDSILVSASFLGWPFAVFKLVSASLMGLIGGWLAGDHEPDDHSSSTSSTDRVPSPANQSWRQLAVEAFAHTLEILRSIWLWLLLGVFVSAAINLWVPASVFASVRSWGAAPAALVALLLSVPLYVCATASVPIAAALVASGFPPGAALVFLVAGPATNVATIGAVFRQFGSRTLGVYLSVIIGGSIIAAILFDQLVTPESVVAAGEHSHEHFGWLAYTSSLVLLALCAWFATDDAKRWWQRRSSPGSDVNTSQLHAGIDGMTCNGCVSKLESVLRKTDGIDSVEVRLNPGEATIQGSISPESLRSAIQKAGFRMTSVG